MDWKSALDDEIVCYCQSVNKGTIVTAIIGGKTSLNDIREVTSACTGGNCKELNPAKRCCSGDILDLIKIYSPEPEAPMSSCCCN